MINYSSTTQNKSSSSNNGSGNGHSPGIDFVFPISPELKDQGIEGFRIKDQNAILTIENGPTVLFPFYNKNYSRSIEKLRNSLESRRIDDRLITFYCLKITELLLEYVLDDKIGKVTKRQRLENSSSWKQTKAIITQIDTLRERYKDISMEVWEMERRKRFEDMRETMRRDAPKGWEATELVLTVKGIQHIASIDLPLIVIMLSNAASYKTFGMDMVNGFPNTVKKDKISNHSWVTHVATENPEELENIDLIRQMKDSLMLIPELAPIFEMREDILRDALSTLTRLADGNGLMSHSGMYGDRGLEGPLMFGFVGAAIRTPVALHKVLASLGPKIYFFTSNVKNATKQELLEEQHRERFGIRKQRCRDKVISYLCWLEVCPNMVDVNEQLKNLTGEAEAEETLIGDNADDNDDDDNADKTLDKRPRMPKRVIEWDESKNEPEAMDMTANLALLLGKIRGSTYAYQDKVMTSLNDEEVEGSTGGSGYQYEYSHSDSSDENTERAMHVLENTAVAHAFELCGRNYITTEDLPIILKIVLSSANKERIKVIKTMLDAKNVSSIIANELDTTRDVDIEHLVHTSYLINKTGISKSPLHRILKELSVLGLIDIYKTTTGSSHENVMIFNKEFDFVYDDAFQELFDRTYRTEDIDTEKGEQT